MKTRKLFQFFVIVIAAAIFLGSSTYAEEPSVANDFSEQDVRNYEFLLKFFETDETKAEECWQAITDSLPRLVYIDLSKQELTLLEFGEEFKILMKFSISSGRHPSSTPTGTFVISKKRLARASKKYGGVMTYWNCLTPDEAIGIHGLQDSNYEKFLGKPVSHGCIRIGKDVERQFYEATPIGTLVLITRD